MKWRVKPHSSHLYINLLDVQYNVRRKVQVLLIQVLCDGVTQRITHTFHTVAFFISIKLEGLTVHELATCGPYVTFITTQGSQF